MADAATQDRELTFGEEAVGLTFNPSGDERVQKVKELYAQIIDIMQDERQSDDSGKHKEVNRLASVAITEAQGAQMWAVKALTFGKK